MKKIWNWIRLFGLQRTKLYRIHEISSIYYNDAKFVRITKIIDE